MRPSIWIPIATTLFFLSAAVAQQDARTDAQVDGFSGSIKSVITTIIRHDAPWRQPDGISLAPPASCGECDYDPNGAKVKSEEDNISIIRDAQGHFSDRRVFDANDVLEVHEVFSPFGVTERFNYKEGKVISSSTFHYDLSGNLAETVFFNSNGQQIERVHRTYDKERVRTESSCWGRNGQLEWQDLFDPQTSTQSFTTFDAGGDVELAWKRTDGKMDFFWERSDKDNQYGDCVTDEEAEDGTRDTHCYANGNRERAFIRYQFTKPKESQQLKRAEWRDGAGNLLYAAYYDYEIDGHRNWTRRVVSVISPELPERTLLEEDIRLIVYW